MSNREIQIERNRKVTAFADALARKVEGEWGRPADDYAAKFAAAWVIFLIQKDFAKAERKSALNYERVFARSKIEDVSVRKYMKDSLGDDLGKLDDLIDRYPQGVLQTWLEMMGINIQFSGSGEV